MDFLGIVHSILSGLCGLSLHRPIHIRKLYLTSVYIVLKPGTPAVLLIYMALALIWSLPAKPASSAATISGFFLFVYFMVHIHHLFRMMFVVEESNA